MNAEILAVGTELLMGQIANTNAQYISRRLNDLGINVYYHSVVGDNFARLKESLSTAIERSDVIVTTGGLGPTKDDLTKETIAEVLGLPLVLHKDIEEKIRVFFKKLNKDMSSNNIKQAYMPKGCIVIPNNNGTAPGCIIENDKKVIVVLPGPPKEMCPMFEEVVFPYFEKKTAQIITSRMLKVFGIGESSLESKLIDIIEKQTNPTVAPYVKQGEITLRVTARCKNFDEAQSLMEPIINQIKQRLENKLYSTYGESMEEVVLNLLIKANKSIAVAESCTGGMLCAKIVNVPGASKVFNQGYVTYSNESKQKDLCVPAKILKKYGAVSKETARAMAEGLKKKTNADICVATTGIAGPAGGSKEKPVGLVYIAVIFNGECCVRKFQLAGDRERVRSVTCLHALDMVRKKLINHN